MCMHHNKLINNVLVANGTEFKQFEEVLLNPVECILLFFQLVRFRQFSSPDFLYFTVNSDE